MAFTVTASRLYSVLWVLEGAFIRHRNRPDKISVLTMKLVSAEMVTVEMAAQFPSPERVGVYSRIASRLEVPEILFAHTTASNSTGPKNVPSVMVSAPVDPDVVIVSSVVSARKTEGR